MIIDTIKILLRIILFNPMTILGVCIGIYVMRYMGFGYVQQILHNPQALAPQVLPPLWGIALAYAILFKHVYKPDSNKVNWIQTFLSSFWHLFVIVFIAGVTCAAYWYFDVDWASRFDRYAESIKTQDELPPTN